MNAQTIQDSVNKYRFGVLVGNFPEERFGIDMANRPIDERLPISTMKATYGLQNSVYAREPNSTTTAEKEFNEHVVYSDKGVQQHLLFGHGVKPSDLEKREYGTSYDLSYNQRIKPQTQIYSKFTPDLTQTARPFNKNTVYEKTYQSSIPELGSKPSAQLGKARAYNEYTKQFDATHTKIPLRK